MKLSERIQSGEWKFNQPSLVKEVAQLEAKNERLSDGLVNLATMTLIREHNVDALVEQLSDIHKTALSILANLDIDALKED